MVKIIGVILTLFLLLSCQNKQNSSSVPQISADTLANVPSDSSAHWVSSNIILIPEVNNNYKYMLAMFNSDAITYVSLKPLELPVWIASKYPHLASFTALQLNNRGDLNKPKIKRWLKAPISVITFDELSQPIHSAKVQTANLLDELYTSSADDADEVNDLGAKVVNNTTTFKLWAPTAKKVTIKLFNDDKSSFETNEILLTENTNNGVWSASIKKDLSYKFYQYNIDVYHPQTKQQETIITTDPYSLSLSTNSIYSQVVDLAAKETQPQQWHKQQDVIVGEPENNIFYETHIRDFSASDTAIINQAVKGKYKAFTLNSSNGINHLKALNKAGINNIHLLPAFDIGTVNEDHKRVINLSDSIAKLCKINTINPISTTATINDLCRLSIDQELSIKNYLSSLSTLSSQAQEIVSAIREVDNYNWGYDPFHYTVPEGSYALEPDGISRIIEFREMVQSIHNLGFRVIMDVVYNHTHKAGLQPTSVLDKIVPNYYQRLNPISGEIEQSTCCDNTATERVMMAKLMTDSLIVWAKDYKIDGFRFDLMAHQPKALMLKAREAVRAVDADTYFYGEGWNFGEVANNQRFIQASQLELSGTQIGTFTDRLRDAVRGGAFNAVGEGHRKNQGIGNGLGTIPNDLQIETLESHDLKINSLSNKKLSQYYVMMDQLRIGLAGNLANYPLVNQAGEHVTGKDVPYGDQPTGYALDPADTINYVSKHDNQTLWDNNQYRIAYNVSTSDRVRMQVQSLAFPILAQGIPFLHMGSDLLRSKSFLRDSYDYSDWFNRVDFGMNNNFYNIGLPPKDKDEANWDMIQNVLTRNEGRDHVSPGDIKFSATVFMEFIQLRMSSPLFRLTTEQQIIDRVMFHNTGKHQALGLIVMSISDENKSEDLDSTINNIVVVFNTNSTEKFVPFTNSSTFKLHPIQQEGEDGIVKKAKVTKKGFRVPALTTAIFVN